MDYQVKVGDDWYNVVDTYEDGSVLAIFCKKFRRFSPNSYDEVREKVVAEVVKEEVKEVVKEEIVKKGVTKTKTGRGKMKKNEEGVNK